LRELFFRDTARNESCPVLLIIKLERWDKLLERSSEVLESLMSILEYPSWYLGISSGRNNSSLEELPLFVSKHLREYTFDEMESIGKSIGLEEGSANLGVAEFDETI